MWANTDQLSNDPLAWASFLGMPDELPFPTEGQTIEVSQAVSYASTVMDKTHAEIDELDQRIKALFKLSSTIQTQQTQSKKVSTSVKAPRSRQASKRKEPEQTESIDRESEPDPFCRRNNLTFTETSQDGVFSWSFIENGLAFTKTHYQHWRSTDLGINPKFNPMFQSIKQHVQSGNWKFCFKQFFLTNAQTLTDNSFAANTYKGMSLVSEDISLNQKIGSRSAACEILACQLVKGRKKSFQVPDPLLTEIAIGLIEKKFTEKEKSQFLEAYADGRMLSLALVVDNQKYAYYDLNIYTFFLVLDAYAFKILNLQAIPQHELLRPCVLEYPDKKKWEAFLPFGRSLCRLGKSILDNETLFKRFSTYIISAVALNCIQYHQKYKAIKSKEFHFKRFNEFCKGIKQKIGHTAIAGTLVERQSRHLLSLFEIYKVSNPTAEPHFTVVKGAPSEPKDTLFEKAYQDLETSLPYTIPEIGKLVYGLNNQDSPQNEDLPVDIMSVPDPAAPVGKSPAPSAAIVIEKPLQPQICSFRIKMVSEEWTPELTLNRTEEIATVNELFLKLTQHYSLPGLLMDALNMEINDEIIKIRLMNPPPARLAIKIEQANSEYLLHIKTLIDLGQFFDTPTKALYQIERIQNASFILLDLTLCN